MATAFAGVPVARRGKGGQLILYARPSIPRACRLRRQSGQFAAFLRWQRTQVELQRRSAGCGSRSRFGN